MEIAVLIISIFLIGLVLLQSAKAESASQIIQGGKRKRSRTFYK